MRSAKLLVALALASSIGVHWTLLQVVAWTGMVVSYSQDAPLSEAVAKTFDGKHPCKLCKQIDEGKKTEKKSEFLAQDQQLTFCASRQAFVFTAPTQFYVLPLRNDSAEELAESPPVPPPRLA